MAGGLGGRGMRPRARPQIVEGLHASLGHVDLIFRPWDSRDPRDLQAMAEEVLVGHRSFDGHNYCCLFAGNQP